jgi:enoyl-[acyl-carrier-protein] reductase (NADH)
MSLGWSAASAWLRRDPANSVLLTVRSERAKAFADAQTAELAGRLETVAIDWSDPDAETEVSRHLERLLGRGRGLAGVVHAIAGAELANFTTPAHALPAAVYTSAFDTTAASLVKAVSASAAHLAPFAGIVTFGFGEFRVVPEEYGGAMATAKLALSQLVAVLGVSLGQADPPARTLEIVTSFIPSYSGRAVAAGISRANGSRITGTEISETFAADAPLPHTDPEAVLLAAGALAVSFIADPMFRHTTGERIHVDGGWATKGKSVLPERPAGKSAERRS